MADQFDKRASARRQALLALLSGTVAEPAAGLAGLYGLATGGVNKGAHNVEATRDALTYHPRDASALEVVGRAVEPVTGRLQKLRDYLGDKTMAHTGSPALATAGYMVPDTLLTLLGARGMGVKGPKLAQMVARSEGPTMGAPQAQMGALMPEYGMAHRPVTVEGGAAQLHDLAPSFGDDIYSPQAAQYFGTGDRALDRETLRVLHSVRGNPNAMVTIYRAVPTDAPAGFQFGDWVTVNKNYAKQHGESTLGGNYKIVEEQVPASHLTTNADSFHEQGYHPPK